MSETGGARILIVDDEPALLRCYRRVLETAGYQVDAVLSAEAALALLADTKFDLILSDLQMPRRDGLELLRVVREKHGDMPFILLTGDTSERSTTHSVQSGATRYLTKPIDSRDLCRTVAIALKDRS